MHKWIALALIACLLQGSTPDGKLREGMDYALFFAVNEYDSASLGTLKNPIQNAKDIASELKENYGFQTEVVENPTLDKLEDKIKEYSRKFQQKTYAQKGQLLLFFSGHGVEDLGNGFFMPKDADTERPHRTGFGYDYWRSKIDAINCQHILVVIDACYSITFDPNWENKPDRDFKRPGELSDSDKIRINHEKYKARFFFTSDGEGDQTPDRSSLAKKFLEGLRTHYHADGYLSSSELFASYLKKGSPVPGGGDFGSDEAASSFLFFRSNTTRYKDAKQDRQAWQAAQDENSLSAYRSYLARFPNGEFCPLGQQKLTSLEQEEADIRAWGLAKQRNTKAAYEEYLRKQLRGNYRELAQYRISEASGSSISKPIETSTTTAPNGHEMIFVEGGTFTMGCKEGRDTGCYDNEKPAHSVSIPSFSMGKYEVTNEQFAAFLNAKGNKEESGSEWVDLNGKYKKVECGIKQVNGRFRVKKGQEKLPMVYVSWYGAKAYCKWLSEQSGKNYRLPTEAEWEFTARGGNKSKNYKYAGSNTAEDVAWHNSNSKRKTHPVGGLAANELGIYDMSGNVHEQCEDTLYDSYENAPTNGSAWLGGDSARRVLRGGSWLSFGSRFTRVSNRGWYYEDNRYSGIGFRIAQD